MSDPISSGTRGRMLRHEEHEILGKQIAGLERALTVATLPADSLAWVHLAHARTEWAQWMHSVVERDLGMVRQLLQEPAP